MTPYFAHYNNDNGENQLLTEHLQKTATLAAQYATPFGAADLGELCGLAHDLGKYSNAFQKRLRGANIRVDHSTAGSKELFERKALSAAFCVAGHHTGLPDGGTRCDTPEDSTLLGRMKATSPADIPDSSAWKTELSLPDVPSDNQKDGLDMAFFTRMLYSCLVDADFLDTEEFFAETLVQRGEYESILKLQERLCAYIEAKEMLRHKNNLNQHRASILAACIKVAAKPKGLYSLTVPTGGGKTIASLAFALHHAVQHGMDRVIYVIPYCSIIDQTAGVFSDILGKDNVLEHHSGVEFDFEENTTLAKRKMNWASENWDMPIVITTAVQFFESLYANKSSRCRKLHNIANSVVVFDEVQILPTPYLMPCVSAIGQLVQHFSVTALLCTATQPALDDLFGKLGHTFHRKEICPKEESKHPIFFRVRFKIKEQLTSEELAARINEHNQALCILNTRAQAQEVFYMLEGEGNFHLSTLMYPAHRGKTLEIIRKRLKGGLPCRVVSTSLIEAGVDLDFPSVYREEAGLDSVLQAAGRCNREGKRPAEESIVTLFKTTRPPPSVIKTNIGALRETLRRHAEPNTQEAIHDYFNTLLDLKGDSALDSHGVIDAFRNGIEGRLLPFKTVAESFSLIDSTATTVYIPVDDGGKLVEQLRKFGVSRSLMRKLGRYGVTVYPSHLNALRSAGDVIMLAEKIPILSNIHLYNVDTGLSLEADDAKGYFI